MFYGGKAPNKDFFGVIQNEERSNLMTCNFSFFSIAMTYYLHFFGSYGQQTWKEQRRALIDVMRYNNSRTFKLTLRNWTNNVCLRQKHVNCFSECHFSERERLCFLRQRSKLLSFILVFWLFCFFGCYWRVVPSSMFPHHSNSYMNCSYVLRPCCFYVTL